MMRLVALVCAAVIISLSPVYAGSGVGINHTFEPDEMASKIFKKMDTNNDNLVTKEEFKASPVVEMIKSFEILGPNEKGVVEKEAFIKAFITSHTPKGGGV
tara:strand:- start:15 stop:317 length:303 start_codon:yes stop_codon:yes gene_type:complete